jgi:hypothetical protein
MPLSLTVIPASFGKGGANLSDGNPTLYTILAEFRAALLTLESSIVGQDTVGNATATNQAATATNQAATAANTASRRAGHVHYVNPLAADYIYIVASALPADGAQILAHQPDVPRKLVIHTVTGCTTALMDIVGIGPSGEAVTESDIDVKAAGDIVTTKAYATVTSITLKSVTGPAGTVGVGQGAALGLPASQVPASSGFVVYKEAKDTADETVGTVDATAGTVAPSVAADGAKAFDFWYTYGVTEVQASHNHTQDSHNHTQDAHTHALS